MEKIFLLLALFSSSVLCLSAQTFQPKQLEQESSGIVYEKEFTIDLRILQTNGFGIGVNIGKLKTYYKTTYWHFELGELKSPKEYRQNANAMSSFPGSPSSYVYGKQNNFFVLRAGKGWKRYLSEKASNKGVAVGYSYEFGPSLGLLKPYYLELTATSDFFGNYTVSEKYSEETANRFLNKALITSSAGIGKGMGELTPIPGIHAQFAFHFDWGAFDEVVKALEAGLILDVFPRTVPILVDLENVENTPVFLNVYVNLQFGKRM